MSDTSAIEASAPLIQNDIVVFGLIAATLGLIFWASSGPTALLRTFFRYVPALLLCYFIPAIYSSTGLIDGQNTQVYNPIARDVLLPAALVLLTLSIDLPAVLRLGPRLLIVFCAGTLGIMLGAIVSYLLFAWLHPQTVAGDVWAGMAALAGSWIGGGANMTAMREVFEVDGDTYAQIVVVDVAVASLWMAVLLFLAGRSKQIDAASGADTRALDTLIEQVSSYQAEHARIPTLSDLMVIVAIGFGLVGLAHAIAVPWRPGLVPMCPGPGSSA